MHLCPSNAIFTHFEISESEMLRTTEEVPPGSINICAVKTPVLQADQMYEGIFIYFLLSRGVKKSAIKLIL